MVVPCCGQCASVMNAARRASTTSIIPAYTCALCTGLGMLGAGLPGLGGLGGADGASNLDGMMQAMQNPGMQQMMQQLMGQPGFMEVRVLCWASMACGGGHLGRYIAI